ncbi:MAG: glycosyltransferase family 2 protein [Cyclobacteriaceae bacterium]
MKLSVVIPAYNEEGSVENTIVELAETLRKKDIDHEIIVVNDNSKDRTKEILIELQLKYQELSIIDNVPPKNGFGYAVRKGLNNFSGDCVAIFMADMSDSPQDLVKFYEKMKSKNLDCVFGSRWIDGGEVVDYPLRKKIINRMANTIVRLVFGFKYNDITNAFKLYRKETIEGVRPFMSPHFNLTLEIPLKAIVRGYSYSVLPNSWKNRKAGEAKLKIREMGSRYFFIMLYCLIEKFFSKGDFKKKWN